MLQTSYASTWGPSTNCPPLLPKPGLPRSGQIQGKGPSCLSRRSIPLYCAHAQRCETLHPSPGWFVLFFSLLPSLTNPLLDIKLNALYDPRLLPDYGGPVFNHHLTKLKQRNIVDASDNLIPPWDEYAALRPGTIVPMKVTLHTYSIDTNRGIGKKVHRVFFWESSVAKRGVDLPNLLRTHQDLVAILWACLDTTHPCLSEQHREPSFG